jgi:hypothetical protein
MRDWIVEFWEDMLHAARLLTVTMLAVLIPLAMFYGAYRCLKHYLGLE